MPGDLSRREGEGQQRRPPLDWPAGFDVSDELLPLRRLLADQVRSIIDLLHSGRATKAELSEISRHLATAKELAATLPTDRLREIVAAEFDGEPDPEFRITSPVSGWANAVAPPLVYDYDASTDDTTVGYVTFTCPYGGPPGHVHGGWVAAVLDEILGRAQRFSGLMGMTGSLDIRYRAPSPLHKKLRASATLQSVDGRKVTVIGDLRDGDRTLATATGLFIAVDFEAMRTQSAEE